MNFFFKKTRPVQPVFIGICAGCMAAQTLFILDKKVGFTNQYPLFIGLLTIFGYHFLSTNGATKTIGWLAGLAAAILFLMNKWPMGRLPLALFAISASYYFPADRRFLFGKNAPLRASTFGKPLSIGVVWAVVTVVPLFLFFGLENRAPALLLMLAERFCFIAALAIGYDLIDEKQDLAAGLRTIPVHFGAVFAKKMAFGLLFTASLATVGQVAVGFYSVKIGTAVVFSFIVAAFLTQNLPKKGPEMDAKMLVDSVMVFQFLLVAAIIQATT